jgi:hypothetical protein
MVNWFSWLWDKHQAFWAGRGGRIVKDAAAGLIKTLGPIAAEFLLALADAEVAKLEQRSGLVGAQKKSAALAAIIPKLKLAGHEVAEREINFAIEVAVQRLNAPPDEL